MSSWHYFRSELQPHVSVCLFVQVPQGSVLTLLGIQQMQNTKEHPQGKRPHPVDDVELKPFDPFGIPLFISLFCTEKATHILQQYLDHA